MVSKLITQTAVWIAAMAAVLFVAAGTVRWPAAWVFLAEMAGLGLAIGLWLARRDPALLAERLTPGFQAAQKTWDKVFMVTVFVLWTSWLVLMALDAGRFGWSRMPVWAQGIGAILIALCMTIACLAFARTAMPRRW
jgi:protein-S-isoprenylcysteine O-methyltransferase Ste14